MRVFPTQLKVVVNKNELDLDDEGKKGYLDASSDLSVQIAGVICTAI